MFKLKTGFLQQIHQNQPSPAQQTLAPRSRAEIKEK
jgi:hypothetical protein